MPDSYQNPYVNRRHMGGGGRRNQLRYHPDTYYAGGIVESGGVTGYSGFPTITSSLTEMVAVIPLNTADGSKTITKLNFYMRTSTGSGAANIYLYEVGGTPESAIATGPALDEDLGFVFTNAVFNEVTLDGGDYAPDEGSQIAIRLSYASGTNFQLGGLMQMVAGARVMWASAIATPIQDTVWEQFDSFTPGIQVQYSDGSREGFHVGMQASSAGSAAKIQGAIASAGCAGIGIQPDEDIAFNYIECFISTGGTTTSAGVARLYIYDENKNFLWKSVNTYDSATSCFSSSARRLKGFEFEDNILQRGSKYYILLGQDASAGDGTNHLLLGGTVGTAYVTLAAPPRDFGENGYHGMWSVSSQTGVANLASNVVIGHYFRIMRKPLTRSSQVF